MLYSKNGNEVLKNAIRKYGENLQKVVAIEEMAELIKEIVKDFRGKKSQENINEEMADVYIMLRQLEIMYGNRLEVGMIVQDKIFRLKSRLEEEKND